MTQQNRIRKRSLFTNRSFLLMWTQEALTQTAQNATFYALMIWVEQKTGSAIHMSLLILSAVIPSILFGMIAGVFIDRSEKKTAIVISNILRGLIIPGFLLFHHNVALIYMVNFIFSAVGQLFAPAELAAVPTLVEKRQLMVANGILNLTFHGTQVAGFILVAPVLVKWLGAEALLIIIAIVFVVGTVIASFLPKMEPPGKNRRRPWATFFEGVSEELGDGWRLIRGDKIISLSMVHLTLAANLMLVMGMLAPGYCTRVLGIQASDTGYILFPAGVGLLLGVAFLPRLAKKFAKRKLVNSGLLAMSLSLLCLGLAGRWYLLWDTRMGNPEFPWGIVGVIVVVTFAVGVAYAFVHIPAQTLLQERAPADMRGRVFATQLVFGHAASVIPLLFLAGLADTSGNDVVMLIVAAIVVGVAIFSHYRTRRLITLANDDNPPLHERENEPD